jgi:hypothetical protein
MKVAREPQVKEMKTNINDLKAKQKHLEIKIEHLLDSCKTNNIYEEKEVGIFYQNSPSFWEGQHGEFIKGWRVVNEERGEMELRINVPERSQRIFGVSAVINTKKQLGLEYTKDAIRIIYPDGSGNYFAQLSGITRVTSLDVIRPYGIKPLQLDSLRKELQTTDNTIVSRNGQLKALKAEFKKKYKVEEKARQDSINKQKQSIEHEKMMRKYHSK